MSSLRFSIAAGAVLMLLLVAALRGQQPQNSPHAGYVYPAGGQQGTTFQVKVGGRFLDGVSGVLVSGRGVRAKVVEHDKPLTGQQITDLREKLQELQKQGNTPGLQKQLQDARIKVGDSLRRNANPTLSEIVTVEVTIAPDAEPGARQVRLQTPLGLTNPLVFAVGQLPEFREKDVKNGKADAELEITLPAVVNGRMIPGDVDRLQFPLRPVQQYMPGDVDRYRFHARKGQHLVVAASARDLMPYLADAVPGWFQATLTLFDATGRDLAYCDDYRFKPDPVLHYEIPDDGDYVVEIKDALYRGREDFVYRIAIGELPFVTSIFPLGGRSGDRTTVEVIGWNLPSGPPLLACLGSELWRGLAVAGPCVNQPAKAGKLTIDEKGRQPGIYPISVRAGSVASNRLPFAVDTLPEAFDREPNNSQRDAQRVTLPVIVNGRIQEPGDWDVFSFAGRAGDDVVAEVTARRLDSPLDSVLELVDAAGRRVAFNDDHEDKGTGLVTHHADSLLTAKLPVGATYALRIGDVQHKGGPEYGYRLRISAPRPDFDLRVAPSDVNATGSGSVPLAIRALRKDGFTGDIALSLKDAPGGFSLSGGLVPAGQDRVRVTLTVPPAATSEPLTVRVEGRATIQGHAVVHDAVPADEMMQAFAYEHLVPADALRVSVGGRGGTRVPASLLSAAPVKIPAGGSARVRVALPPGWLTFENVQFELSEPPDGISLRDASIAAGAVQGVAFGFGRGAVPGAEFTLRADGAKVKPGTRGNLIVTISGERAGRGAQQAAAARRRLPMGTLPAIAFEITGGKT
jgi:hypothetical protein